MILNTAPESKAIVSNAMVNSDFKIKASAKAFSILSSGLYSNKIKAIIRELSCNAYDSHVAAGKADVPFDIHLPNYLEPNFYIRDYGVGLNDVEVNNVYTTYFESTKTGSNEFVGALGLGSKTPFCYTDNFTITAWKEGICRIYTAYINDFGCPSIVLLSESQSNEPSGVKIEFSVNVQSDYTKFTQEAEAVFSYFNVKPNFIGSVVPVIPEKNIFIKDLVPGTNVYKFNLSNSKFFEKSVAIMGNIAYPIDIPNSVVLPEKVRDIVNENFGLSTYKLRGDNNVYLEISFDIGELDFQASREALAYTSTTIASIIRKFEQIYDALFPYFQKEIADVDVDDIWSYAQKMKELSTIGLWSLQLKDFIGKHSQKTGLSVYRYATSTKVDLIYPKVEHPTSDDLQELGIKKSPLFKNRYLSYALNTDPNISSKEKIIINDAGYSMLHLKSLLHDLPSTTVVFSKIDKKSVIDWAEFITTSYKKLPESKIIYSSTLAKPTPKIKPESNDIVVLTRDTRIRYSRSTTKNPTGLIWVPIGSKKELRDSDLKIWVPLKGYDTTLNNQHFTKDSLAPIMKLFSITKLYGVRKSSIDVVKNDPEWKSLEELIKEKIEDPRNVELIKAYLFHDKTMKIKFLLEDSFVENLEDTGVLKNIYRKYEKQLDNFLEISNAPISLYRSHAIERLYPDWTSQFRNFEIEVGSDIIKITSEYPMLEYVINVFSNVKQKVIEDYIKLVDTSKGVN